MADAPPGALKMGERDHKDKVLQERLDRRGEIMAGCMRKFMINYWMSRQIMLDEMRALEAAKRSGKRKKKGKKGAKDSKDLQGDKKKRKIKTPVQEAWALFLSELDDRINKRKRCNLEDIYRGVLTLTNHEKRAFSSIVATSDNKKVLPTEGLNVNLLNIRQMIVASAVALDATVDDHRATILSSGGMIKAVSKGTSEVQLLDLGFKESDLLRAGFSRQDVLSFAIHNPVHLYKMGASVHEVLGVDFAAAAVQSSSFDNAPTTLLLSSSATAKKNEQQYGGVHGARLLLQAGYSVDALLESSLLVVDSSSAAAAAAAANAGGSIIMSAGDGRFNRFTTLNSSDAAGAAVSFSSSPVVHSSWDIGKAAGALGMDYEIGLQSSGDETKAVERLTYSSAFLQSGSFLPKPAKAPIIDYMSHLCGDDMNNSSSCRVSGLSLVKQIDTSTAAALDLSASFQALFRIRES
ncbi:hypothetical protein CEUSTIGMA_g12246.t1 [Chlamydomonas eustigma]|uniref:Uncharacterized protein n=1 Tax=Chlamydomonas eustigma TaxID=1157962 RepID=A0A250XP15_9CHLO|nr:hypothetical protein CEUSTIGMA_g12246.t1 [Chlamydomonas eustigma]|eukprot:GAX84825.1 hypothetical protein CEUSTIGMA_g12246.t1 [Chlamydomonas eustigma]